MTTDSYGINETQARCAECGKFMPWSRSHIVEKGDGFPVPSPIYVERGLCFRCELARRKNK